MTGRRGLASTCCDSSGFPPHSSTPVTTRPVLVIKLIIICDVPTYKGFTKTCIRAQSTITLISKFFSCFTVRKHNICKGFCQVPWLSTISVIKYLIIIQPVILQSSFINIMTTSCFLFAYT